MINLLSVNCHTNQMACIGKQLEDMKWIEPISTVQSDPSYSRKFQVRMPFQWCVGVYSEELNQATPGMERALTAIDFVSSSLLLKARETISIAMSLSSSESKQVSKTVRR